MTDVSLRYLLFGEDRTASKSMKNVESAATRSGKAVGSSFSKMGSVIGGEVGELLSKAGEGISKLSESAKGMAPKLAAGGAAVGGLGAALSMLGSKDKEAQNQLQAALTATGNSLSDYKEEIESAIKKNEGFGHSAADTQQALATMTEALGDPKKALEQMGTVADLAAAKHVSLQSAADMVSRGVNGATKVFKQYGIVVQSTSAAQAKLDRSTVDVANAQSDRKDALAKLIKVQKEVKDGTLTGAKADDALKAAQKGVEEATKKVAAKQHALKVAHMGVKDATDSTSQALDELSKKLHGQAAASVDSFAGRLRVMKTRAEDAVAQFGQKFGPALQVSGVAMMGFAAALEVGQTLALGTRIQLGLLSVQETLAAARTKAVAAAQWLLNAAMEANPIGLIIVALVALIAVFVLLWKHSETFRHIVTAAFGAVTSAASTAWSWIKQHWPLILAILTGPVGVAVLFIVSHWKQIKTAFGDALDGVKGLWHTFSGWLTGLPGKIGSAVSGMWDGIKDGFKAALNAVIDIWNSMPSFKIPSITVAGHKIGGGTISLPHLSHVATGGVMTSSGAVILGEHGREVVDMPAGARVRPLSAMDTHSSSAGGDDLGTLTVVVKSDTGEVIEQKLVKVKRKRGGRALEFV
jgi:phage-related protein